MIEPEIRGGQIRRSQRNSGGSQHGNRSQNEVLGRVAELEPMIRAASAEAEIERRLSAHVAEAPRDAGCYHLFRPRSRGGLS